METRALGTATKIAGTPGFQAPEKLRGEALTTAVDVYSLGGVLTELFSGKPLYNKMDTHTIICKVAVQNIMTDREVFGLPGWLGLFKQRIKGSTINQSIPCVGGAFQIEQHSIFGSGVVHRGPLIAVARVIVSSKPNRYRCMGRGLLIRLLE